MVLFLDEIVINKARHMTHSLSVGKTDVLLRPIFKERLEYVLNTDTNLQNIDFDPHITTKTWTQTKSSYS